MRPITPGVQETGRNTQGTHPGLGTLAGGCWGYKLTIALKLGHDSYEFLTTLRTSVHPEKGKGTLQMYKDVTARK